MFSNIDCHTNSIEGDTTFLPSTMKFASLAGMPMMDVAPRTINGQRGAIDIPFSAEALKKKALHGNCYGRVSDLETMVPAQWWKKVFADAIYLKTDGDVVEDPEITREEIAMLEKRSGVAEIFQRGGTVRVLDLCCGQGRHLLHLAKEYPNLQLYGHDQSSYLIGLAKERASLAGLTSQTQFTVGDCRQIPYPDDMFDLVLIMGNSFGYFATDDADKALLNSICRVLKPKGRMILDLTDGAYMKANYAERSWEWVDDSCFVCRERQLSKDGKRLNSREVVTITNIGVVRDQFYQERLYDRSEVEELVEDCGLRVVRDSDATDSCETLDDNNNLAAKSPTNVITIAGELSKRKEDLGMMEYRLLIEAIKSSHGESSSKPSHSNGLVTAGACDKSISDNISKNSPNNSCASVIPINPSKPPLEWIDLLLPKPVSKSIGNVVVLLGDPSKLCFGKLNNQWNAEDMATRNKMFAALHELGLSPENVTCVEKHDDLLEKLSSVSKDHIVFNLCDEGFQNDALKELHVPALLEMMNLSYSGAGPNCLAICYDKGLVNRTASAVGVPVPTEFYFFADYTSTNSQELKDQINSGIGYPAFLKPLKGDNSLGITSRSIVYNDQELQSYLVELQSQNLRDIIIQEYLQGTEYGVGMVGNTETGFHFFPILEVDFSTIIAKQLPPILGYESKWEPSSPYWTDIKYKRAILTSDVEARLKNYCRVLWDRFGCRDYARFDFRCTKGRGDGLDDGVIKLLEVNPNPGWCWDGKLAYMAKLDGYSYSQMLSMILNAARIRLAKALL